jgi:ferrochelatase
MDYRKHDLPYTVAFQHHLGLSEMLEPGMRETLQELGRTGQKAVLVVPVAFVTDLIETVFTLDVEMREQAHMHGVRHFEVASALNCHPLFIEALADVTRAMLTPVDSTAEVEHARENGKAAHASALVREVPTRNGFHPRERHARCNDCLAIIEARCWEERPASIDTPSTPPSATERTS